MLKTMLKTMLKIMLKTYVENICLYFNQLKDIDIVQNKIIDKIQKYESLLDKISSYVNINLIDIICNSLIKLQIKFDKINIKLKLKSNNEKIINDLLINLNDFNKELHIFIQESNISLKNIFEDEKLKTDLSIKKIDDNIKNIKSRSDCSLKEIFNNSVTFLNNKVYSLYLYEKAINNCFKYLNEFN